jgi:hypothetical protein
MGTGAQLPGQEKNSHSFSRVKHDSNFNLGVMISSTLGPDEPADFHGRTWLFG